MGLSLETYALLRKYVNKKIKEASEKLQWKIVICDDELPYPGETQTYYFLLIKDETAEENNYYDEYIWLGDQQEYEKIGSTKMIIIYDDELSLESENAVQNKVVTAALNQKLEDGITTFVIDGDTIVAEGADTITWTSGENVTLSADTQTKEITISAVDTQYEGESIYVGSASNWNPGALPTLGANIEADKISNWNEGTTPSFTIEGEHILVFDEGSTPSLNYNTQQIPNVTNTGTLPSITIDSTEVLNGISEVDDD